MVRRMIRRILYELLLFLSPFALYAAYWRLAAREQAEGVRHAHPWTWLFASGLLLVAASLVYWGLTAGEPADRTYVPPHVENGQVVPGHFEQGGAQ